MPKLWVKDAGTWKQVKQLYVKDGGVWKSPTVGLINDAGIGKQFYPDTAPTIVYSTPGTRTYTVPAGVSSLRISYPTTSGIVNTTLAVTGGQVLSVVTGDYNAASSIGTLSIPAYSKAVFTHSGGNIDNTLTQTFSVATTNVANASTTNTTQGPSSTNLNVNGIFFQNNGEGNQGDFGETVQISTVPISTLVGNYITFGQIISSRGESSVIMEQQPTSANSWRSRFTVTEYGYSNYPVAFRINIQQQGYISITPLNANIITYNTAGTYSFTVPAGVISITLTGAGGGGGGAGADGGSNYQGHGAGGGGSNLITTTYSTVPGSTLSITVGAGGNGGTGPYGTGGTGQTTTVTGTGVSFSAAGGGGGTGGGNGGSGFTGVGANGANYLTSFRASFPSIASGVIGGTSTNGGSNGGAGGQSKNAGGSAGQAGKLILSYGYLS